ncbi:18803_t:CDS:2 [Entrophospora sp. SA101]|nr:18803_t:CDS:2 [Entrophospora sp. SA101]CAJ0843640.1 6567_t:CDS:2 [Entrophospora sp. SA101]CAJ0909263.1 14554_t:CDS:2 [Entrophospora sp. SA101]CAJ0912809.1 6608_t:CDS:2 [Entrophospora sp. SA101]
MYDLPWKCNFDNCDKSFKFLCRLEKHQQVHTNERPFKCTFEGCEKSYKRSDHLKLHSIVHNPIDSKPFKCSVEGCESKFSLKHHLNRHIKELHEIEKPYKCNYESCNQPFKQDYLLRKHQKLHTGEKLYPCEICTKSFSTSTKLQHHNLVHSNEKRWLCTFQQCQQEFSKYPQLLMHLKNDHKSICEICGKELKNLKHLRSHMKTHNYDRIVYPSVHENIRPYVCSIRECGMSFAYKKVLTNHMKSIHESPKPRKQRRLNNDNDKFNHETTELECLTGYNYENSGRMISCTIEGCLYLFKREYDLDRHLKSFHNNVFWMLENEDEINV